MPFCLTSNTSPPCVCAYVYIFSSYSPFWVLLVLEPEEGILSCQGIELCNLGHSGPPRLGARGKPGKQYAHVAAGSAPCKISPHDSILCSHPFTSDKPCQTAQSYGNSATMQHRRQDFLKLFMCAGKQSGANGSRLHI